MESTNSLLVAAVDGDERSWEELVDRLLPDTWAVALRASNTPEFADRASHTAWLRLAQRRTSFDDDGTLATWLADSAETEAERLSRTHVSYGFGDWSPPDVVPDGLRAAVVGSRRSAAAQSPVARLIEDTSSRDEVMAPPTERGVWLPLRSRATDQLLTFAGDEAVIELGVIRGQLEQRLVGQLTPRKHAEVRLHAVDDADSTKPDELGQFRFGSVPSGPMSLECRGVDPRDDLQTEWVAI